MEEIPYPMRASGPTLTSSASQFPPIILALLVFGVDAESAGFIEGEIEGLGFLDDNVAKLLFLGEADRLKLDHFEHRKKRDDHGVTRRASFEELNEAYGTSVASKNLRTKLRDHLRDGVGFVLQFDAGNFLFAFENLLEDADEVDERDDQFAFRTFVVVERLVRLGPDVFLDLLTLVEKLGGVLEFFMLQEALDKFFARVFSLLLGTGQRVRWGSILDLM